MSDSTSDLLHRLHRHLEVLYPHENLSELGAVLLEDMGLDQGADSPEQYRNHWDQRDCLLITYGNSIVDGVAPLEGLRRFLREELQGVVSAVHLLPFFPYSSDDGFAVIDYLAVDEQLGDWSQVEGMARDFDLMVDVVINHVSSHSAWFQNYRDGRDPGKDYFIEADPEADLGDVVRPRNTPLLTEVETQAGTRYVWSTFGPEQIDLNFANPQVLREFVRIVRDYLERGARILRLDAVAFLWKRIGTPCIHLQETHEVVKLLRTLVEHKRRDAILITETNVPNRENLTYFGNSNEAHAIYNFSLPPLLLHTLMSGDCRHLKTWMMSMPPPQNGTAYLNFIASHDGIGLRPLDGLLEQEEIDSLIDTMRSFGGRVSYRRSREGPDKAYEINIALFDALKGTSAGGVDGWQVERFLCAHAIMLALEGIPAFYIHSLLATGNDYIAVERSGRLRTINRHRWSREALDSALRDPMQHHGRVFSELRRLIRIRRAQPAFHPNATQFTLHLGTQVFAFWRQSQVRDQSIFCINNITADWQRINLADINLIQTELWVDLISGDCVTDFKGALELAPYQCVWLSNRGADGPELADV